MKNLLISIMILLLPLSVMAMTPVSDSTLSDVTGQAGVNINADITMDISIGTMAWGDDDGIAVTPLNPWTSAATGGYIGITGFNITNLHIRARTEAGDMYNGYKTVFLKPITIDVATGEKLGETGVTFVRFGLGALQISLDQLQFTVALSDHAYTGDLTLEQTMGVVTLGAMDIYINPWSYVDIYSHEGCGVNFDFNVVLDRVELPYMSWGDTDGLPGGNTGNQPAGTPWMTDISAGYVGLNNFVIGDANHPAVVITGSVAIDVTTSAQGVYAQLYHIMNQLRSAGPGLTPILRFLLNGTGHPITDPGYSYDYTDPESITTFLDALEEVHHGFDGKTLSEINTDLDTFCSLVGVAYDETNDPITAVHISFPADFTFQVAKMTGDVVLGDTADFGNVSPSAVTGELGDIYIQSLAVVVKQGSWIDIWAH